MTGIVGSKLNIRGSGIVAKLGTDGQALTSSGAGVAAAFEDLAAGTSWQTIVTGSTMTAVAGNGYWVDTSSNACTITLPASASVGDTIIFTDYARNWGTNGITIDSNGLNYQSDDDTFTIEYGTDGMSLAITYMNATQGWVPTIDEAVADVPVAPSSNPTGIFGFGTTGSAVDESNLVSITGVVSADVTGVGTDRWDLAACEYGEDKGIFGFGWTTSAVGMTNLVSNAGVVATDVTAVGTARYPPVGATYGGDKGIFWGGYTGTGDNLNTKNLVSNAGVVASDAATSSPTATRAAAACEYSSNKDKAIFGFGYDGSSTVATSILVSNTGVVGADVAAVGTVRYSLAACDYGGDKGIFGFGAGTYSMTNLVSNTGVVATDTTGVGTGRRELGATQYGYDKGIFGFGNTGSVTGVTNLVSNTGVVASDVSAVGTARRALAACSYG